MRKSKIVKFKVNGQTVEEIDGDEVTITQVESTKSCLAHLHGVPYDSVEVDTEDIEKPEVSQTMFVTDHMGLCFKAPNPYSVFRSVDCPVLNKDFDFNYQDEIDKFLDALSLYMKKNNPKELDDFIIFM